MLHTGNYNDLSSLTCKFLTKFNNLPSSENYFDLTSPLLFIELL